MEDSNKPQMQSRASEILKPEDAARYLAISLSTLNKARVYGTGPRFCRFGRSIRYMLSDLDAWAAARRAESTTDADNRLPRRMTDQIEPDAA